MCRQAFFCTDLGLCRLVWLAYTDIEPNPLIDPADASGKPSCLQATFRPLVLLDSRDIISILSYSVAASTLECNMSDHETATEGVARQNAIDDGKRVEFYSQGVAAWFNSALEHDKSLLTLSVAGIGVLTTTMQSAVRGACTLVIYGGAILAFLVCLVSVLLIFKQNKRHILEVVSGRMNDDPVLSVLDSAASLSFFTAVLLSALLGVSTSITTYVDKEKKMANENIKNTSQSVPTFDSVNGLAALNPVTESFNQMATLQKSFQGMAQLQGQVPTAQGQSPQTATANQAQPTQAQGSQSGSGNK